MTNKKIIAFCTKKEGRKKKSDKLDSDKFVHSGGEVEIPPNASHRE
jgi:hypothetical protein